MRARLMYLDKETRKACGVFLWQIFKVNRIVIETTKHKYKREMKVVYCEHLIAPYGEIKFYCYEVELIEN